MARYGRVGFYARLTGLLLSIEPLADVIGIDACYDGENKVKYNTQSSHPLSANVRLRSPAFSIIARSCNDVNQNMTK